MASEPDMGNVRPQKALHPSKIPAGDSEFNSETSWCFVRVGKSLSIYRIYIFYRSALWYMKNKVIFYIMIFSTF